jgi:DNA-binding LacI/PurR family transcriptional regulator
MQSTIKSKVTIKDVARACGVSTQTISRVLNDRVDVSSATREKVLAVIGQMGYQPSALARSMRQRNNTMGVIIAGLRYIGISTTLNGITQAAEAFGINIMLKELPTFDSLEMQPLIQSLVAHQVQGIIYAAPEVGENWKIIQKSLTDQTPPIVFLKGNPTSADITISIDNYSGAYQITQHLIKQGYRQIAHITGPSEWWEARERKRGWIQALLDNGLPVLEEAQIRGNWSSSSGLECFYKLQTQYPQMDAVFAANDQMALAVLNGAWQKGISVPNQLGVAGYDNIQEAAYLSPPLTTMRQNFHELGAMAVRKLVSIGDPDQADPEVSSNTLLLTPELIVRKSTMRE